MSAQVRWNRPGWGGDWRTTGARSGCALAFASVRASALVPVLAPEETVELFLREEEALAALRASLDVPEWGDVFRVEAVDLGETQPSPN